MKKGPVEDRNATIKNIPDEHSQRDYSTSLDFSVCNESLVLPAPQILEQGKLSRVSMKRKGRGRENSGEDEVFIDWLSGTVLRELDRQILTMSLG